MSIVKTDVNDSLPGGWRVVRLGDVVEVIGGSTPSRVVSEFWNGDIPWVVPTEVTNLKGRFLVSTTDTITSDGMRSAGIKMIPANSVLLTSRATIGAVAINKIPVSTNQGFQSLVPHHDVDTLWLYYLAGSMKRQLDRLAVGSTFREVHRSTMRKVQILLPPIDQQRKIAEVLDSIDDAVERTEGVIGATEQVRDALLYELLSRGMPGWHREWRDVPGVGTLPASWDVVRLGDVAEVVMGQSPPGPTVFELDSDNQIDTGLPFIQGNAEFGDYFPHPVKWCVKPRKTAQPGDILISVRAPVGDTNRAIETIAIGRGLVAVRFTAVDPDFGWHAINLAKVELERVRQGTTFDAIGKKDIANLTISIPPIDQQRKIAEVLDSIDDSLDGLRAERDGMQVLKRSVADGLLTGRVSVPVVRD